MITFSDFCETRVWSDDLAADVTSENWEGTQGKPVGWLYLDYLYIQQVADWWPEAARREGKWYLILGRDEYITDDLRALEMKLHAFANAEGYELPTLDQLITEYEEWNRTNGLSLGSADEHLFDERLNKAQQAYLQGFSRRWERAEQREHEARAIERRAVDEGISDRLSKATPLLLKALRMVEAAIRKNAGEDTPVLLHEDTQAAVQAALDALDGK
jgi:hypothetical protein